jgi:hypothetical protein
MGILRLVEVQIAIAQAAIAKAQEAAALAREVTTHIASATPALSADIVEAALERAETSFGHIQRGIAFNTGAQIAQLERDVARADKVFNGEYSITAKDLTLTSKPAPENVAPTRIDISAEGGARNGIARIHGSEKATLCANDGSLIATLKSDPTESYALIRNIEPGYIMLKQGLGLGPTLVLESPPTNTIVASVGATAAGSTVTVGLPGTTITALAGGVGSTVEIKPTGLTLSLGQPGVGPSISLKTDSLTLAFSPCNIVLNAVGITLSAGPNSVKVTTTGIEFNGIALKFNALGQLVSKGPIMQIQG